MAIFVGSVLGLIYFGSVVTAQAQTEPTAQVSVATNGQTMVRGARVVSVSGDVITAVTTWGSTSVKWRVLTTGSTRFVPQMNSREMLRAIARGHVIAFSGPMDMSSEQPTIVAGVIKNESLLKSAVVVDGSILRAGDAMIEVATEHGTSTVAVSTGTIMTLDGNRVRLRDLRPGATIKAFGTLNTVSEILAADRVTVTRTAEMLAQPQQKRSFFSGIVSWLRGSEGQLSVR
jgi:hypothetical protein